MKTKRNQLFVLFIVVLVTAFAGRSQASAADSVYPPAHYLGTLREYMKDIQRLPDIINTAICDKNEEEYQEKYQILVKRISDVEWLMDEMGLKNTMNLQIIPTTFLKHKECGIGKVVTGYADTAREKLQLELDKSGLE